MTEPEANIVENILKIQSQLIEELAAAYYQKTRIPPDRAVLVQQRTDGGYRWWFEERGPGSGIKQ